MTGEEQDPSTLPIDWESFYRNLRKPGYVPGYEVTSKLGGGMFGLVYKATKQSIGKDYAIKFLKVDDQEVRRAILGELESVRYFAQVDHPNLVSIEDQGVVDGIPYIIMAYAGSDTLRSRLAAGERDVRGLLRLFLQACRGVQALHERSLVHFDLKPANVFIKGDVARVGDYGLSKLVSASRNSLSMGRGTPYYMAPEMLQRRGDLRSDIYSLGVILYECLTGEVPFKGDSEWEVLRAHEERAVAFPDGVAPEHRRVVERCMAKDPADRYPDVLAIIEDLRAPASPAAAAVEDVRSGAVPPGAGGGRRQPPPLPGPPRPRRVKVPPPLPESARRAKRVVSEIGGKAGRRGRDAASRAVHHAKGAAQEAVTGARWAAKEAHEGIRAWRARRRVRAAERRARRGARPRRSWGGMAAAAVLVVVLMGTWFTASAARVSPPGRLGAGAGQAPPPTGPVAVRDAGVGRSSSTDRNTVVEQIVTAVLEGTAVNPGDGSTAAVVDPQTAIPLPTGTAPLPLDPPVVSGPTRRRIGAHLDELLTTEDEWPVAQALERQGHPAFALAVHRLGRLDLSRPEDARAATRLNRLLREWTGLDSIRMLPPEHGRPPTSADLEFNRQAVAFWCALYQHRCQTPQGLRTVLERIRETRRAPPAQPALPPDSDR